MRGFVQNTKTQVLSINITKTFNNKCQLDNVILIYFKVLSKTGEKFFSQNLGLILDFKS